jgi:hypothetical protein
MANKVLQGACQSEKKSDNNSLRYFGRCRRSAGGNFDPANPANISGLMGLERFR